jgi:hypothetical protein
MQRKCPSENQDRRVTPHAEPNDRFRGIKLDDISCETGDGKALLCQSPFAKKAAPDGSLSVLLRSKGFSAPSPRIGGTALPMRPWPSF